MHESAVGTRLARQKLQARPSAVSRTARTVYERQQQSFPPVPVVLINGLRTGRCRPQSFGRRCRQLRAPFVLCTPAAAPRWSWGSAWCALRLRASFQATCPRKRAQNVLLRFDGPANTSVLKMRSNRCLLRSVRRLLPPCCAHQVVCQSPEFTRQCVSFRPQSFIVFE